MSKRGAKYKNIFFDFDGTLFDTREGIFECLFYTLDKVKKKEVKKKVSEELIGPPIESIFRELFPEEDKEFLEECIKIFRKEYGKKGIFMVKQIKGLERMLKKLIKGNKRLIIISNKPKIFVNKILSEFKIENYFDCIIGTSIGQVRLSKTVVLRKTIKKLKVRKEEAVMVGDREDDILAARENGIASLGVAYGFGSSRELIAFGADTICNSLEELGRILSV